MTAKPFIRVCEGNGEEIATFLIAGRIVKKNSDRPNQLQTF
jgi:hypothetical protein